MQASKNIRITLRARPSGWVSTQDFACEEATAREPAQGQVLLRTLYLSVDPYMRGRMNAQKSYIPPFEIGKPIEGGGIAEVVASQHPGYAPGDVVIGMMPWQALSTLEPRGLYKAVPDAPLPAQLGALGMPGLTAYVGLLDIGQPKAGDTVLVSGAAGAVGSVVGQLAKIHGCRVVGSAGSDEKVQLLTRELGFDAAFNYKTCGDLRKQLATSCPQGIDVYFDNVGGSMLEAVLFNLREHARIVECGMISVYNEKELPPGPRNLAELVRKRARMEGFLVSDHSHRMKDFVPDMLRWIKEGKLVHRETIVDGLENAPTAFVGMLKGENVGKMLVRVAER